MADIKISLRGVDKEKFIVHNKNVLNSVVETLNTATHNIKAKKMKVNSINTYSYQNINRADKQYATRPVFKQAQQENVIPTAIIETLVESANDKKNRNLFMSKINYFRDVLFSDETTRKAKQLQEAIDRYDSAKNILYNA